MYVLKYIVPSYFSYDVNQMVYILVMQRFLVVYVGISQDSLVYQGNTSDEWDIPRYTTRKGCITILYHAIENTVASKARWEGWVEY